MNARASIVAAVVVSHFAAAFAALGMPPFFPLIFSRSLQSDVGYLAGWAYVLPTLLTALSGPWWGALADRFGKKELLLRAQLGLAASFLLAGFANSVPMFLMALALQGLLGGAFAASNAYLATLAQGRGLTRTLTLMQGSARAAMVIAPAALGAVMAVASPIELYRYLALLPLSAALVVACLPASDAPQTAAADPNAFDLGPALRRLALLQFAFAFGTVVTFPYFVPFAQARLSDGSPALAGILFGLPHLVYLVSAAPLSLFLARRRPQATLATAFLLLAASLAGQALAADVATLSGWRAAMGLAMTAGFIGLHGAVAEVAGAENAGRVFGWLDSASKWGGVGAGVVAGLAADAFGSGAPMLVGALAFTAAGVAALAAAPEPRREFFHLERLRHDR